MARVEFPVGAVILSFSSASRLIFGCTLLSTTGSKDSFSPPGVKRPEREADHSPPSSAEVKNDVMISLPNTSP
jgi:hypothetical protein